MCYVGHEEGAQEEQEVIKWASQLNKTNYLVTYHTLINRLKGPALCFIQKKVQ
jgi:hypothetical protein